MFLYLKASFNIIWYVLYGTKDTGRFMCWLLQQGGDFVRECFLFVSRVRPRFFLFVFEVGGFSNNTTIKGWVLDDTVA